MFPVDISAPAERVDLTPSTGKWGRPYSKNCLEAGDIIDIAAIYVENVVKISCKKRRFIDKAAFFVDKSRILWYKIDVRER